MNHKMFARACVRACLTVVKVVLFVLACKSISRELFGSERISFFFFKEKSGSLERTSLIDFSVD